MDFNYRFETHAKSVSLKHGLLNGKTIPIDLDFVKKNFFSILERLLDDDNDESNKTISSLLVELKRLKFKFPPETSSQSTYQLLFKSMRNLHFVNAYPSIFIKSFRVLERFIKMYILGGAGGPPLLTLNGESKLVFNYICRGVLTNSLNLFIQQSHSFTESTEKIFFDQLFG